ncbi:MAG TPA: YdbH domain-containing protein [Nitrospira sp.]|nr:YdbH domain-containing protein [Nitrospira sp.]
MRSVLIRAGLVVASLVFLLTAAWALLPAIVSHMCAEWLRGHGFERVSLRLSPPGLSTMLIDELKMERPVNGERLLVEVRGAAIEYSLAGLWSKRIDRVALQHVTVGLRRLSPPELDADTVLQRESAGSDETPAALSVSDLLQRLPAVPLAELDLRELIFIREAATGPFRRMTIRGNLRQQIEGLLAEFTLQGEERGPYLLRVSDLSTHIVTVNLERIGSGSQPIVVWRSEAAAAQDRSQVQGTLDVNVQELAPVLAFLIPALSEWRDITGRVHAKWAGTLSPSAAVAAVWRDPATAVQGTVQVNIRAAQVSGFGRDLACNFTARFSGNGVGIHWSLDPGTLLSGMLEPKKEFLPDAIQGVLPVGGQPFRAESGQTISGKVHWTDSTPAFSVKGPLAVSYDAAPGSTHVELVLDQAIGSGTTVTQAEARFEVLTSLPDAIVRQLSVQRLSLRLAGNLRLRNERLEGTVEPSSALSAVGFRHGPVRFGRAVIEVRDALPFTVDPKKGLWTVERSTVMLRISDLLIGDFQLSLPKTKAVVQQITGSLASWGGEGAILVEGLVLKRFASESEPIDVDIRVSAQPALLKAAIDAGNQKKTVTLDARIAHELKTGRGDFHASLSPVVFGVDAFRVDRVWRPWPLPVVVNSGRLRGTVDLGWDLGKGSGLLLKTGAAEVELDRITGQYSQLRVSGLSTTLSFRVKPGGTISTTRPAQIKIASVSQGLQLTNVSFSTEVEWAKLESLPVVEVRDIGCETLGGHLTSQGVRADLGRRPFSFTVLARALDLSEILRLERQKGLQGWGLLDGTIPMTVTDKGITVRDAFLEARPPGGIIQYQPDEGTKSVTAASSNMDWVLKALNNFHYNMLQVGARYSADGILNLDTKLEGRNPNLKQVPPVHFNLTVQENIPALMKSLRLIEDVEGSLRERVLQP